MNFAARRTMWGVPVLAAATLLAGAAVAQAPADATYFEFGTVVAMGRASVDIQTFDQSKGRVVQHTFLLSKDTRADVFRAGDSIEVIFASVGPNYVARRLVVLANGIPLAGIPGAASSSTGSSSVAAYQPPAARVPATQPVKGTTAGAKGKAVPQVGAVTLPATAAGKTRTPSTAGSVSMPAPGTTKAAPTAASVAPVTLGGAPERRAPGVTSVGMGGADPTDLRNATPRAKTIGHDAPSEECNRSDAGWPQRPIRIAVLDFRYPTEQEESHAIGTTGGGSGTAVADLVFDRLQQIPEMSWSRGDRDKLYRADFAGAARLGRQMGVDAVLAGTFQPVEQQIDKDGFAIGPKYYELRAGMVDTCTGQLLMRLSSAVCPGGVDLGGTQSGCQRFQVTAKQATDPRDSAGSFKPALDALLLPLEHEGTPPGQKGSAGTVVAVDASSVTLKLDGTAKVKVGDQVALHAWRLSKNFSTYTLHVLKDEEIGRVTIQRISGANAVGTFQGDFPPRLGDTAESVSE